MSFKRIQKMKDLKMNLCHLVSILYKMSNFRLRTTTNPIDHRQIKGKEKKLYKR